eukprot:CAMPEP_0115276526 /NCGR_PEP_ID=MMETSP0270-20121206/56763_1 /TAXON_ID=71861 /ORGANISM="Scrippsiella trochoidea, Strain CCMP3099" /LENGTH=209 /DNA_ID=CAMNT_0002693125 /DNA_START=1255 /DNA_END=1883 /DNA_ORIENTATION=-
MVAEHLHLWPKDRRGKFQSIAAAANRATERGGTATTTAPAEGPVLPIRESDKSPMAAFGKRGRQQRALRSGVRTSATKPACGHGGPVRYCRPSLLCHQRSVWAHCMSLCPDRPLQRRWSSCCCTIWLKATSPILALNASMRMVRLPDATWCQCALAARTAALAMLLFRATGLQGLRMTRDNKASDVTNAVEIWLKGLRQTQYNFPQQAS